MNFESVLYTRTMQTRLGLILLFLCGLFVTMTTGCGGGASAKTLPLTIAFASGQLAPPPSVMAASSAQFAAVVSNDNANLGVSWLLTCNSANSADCGSISRHTASGVPTTYVAPHSPPPGGTVTVVANSSSVPDQSITATIQVAPITYGPLSIAFSPTPPSSVAIGTTQGFVAVVTNDHLDNNGTPMGYKLTVTCGNPPISNAGTCGFFTGNSYTPPANIPDSSHVTGGDGTVTITATSVADATKSASVAVTITPPTVSISLAQLPATSIAAGAATNIGAIAKSTTGNKNDPAWAAGVDWSVTCGVSICGSFIPQHTASYDANNTKANNQLTSYTAPSVVPPGGTVTVIATSTADTTKQVSITITITPATLRNDLLNGQYAFLLSGVNIFGPSAIAGSIVADGNGNITAAEESLPGQSVVVNGIAGSYFIGSDGRGIMTLNGLPGFSNGGWRNGQQIFAITIVDSTQAFMEEFDGWDIYTYDPNNKLYNLLGPYGSTLRGSLEQQKPSDFSVTPSGAYTFAWSAATPTGFYGAAYYGGALGADATGNITSFTMDRYVKDATGSISNGTYGAQSFSRPDLSFGHGTVKIGPYTFNYFMVDSEHIIVLGSSSSDSTGLPAGHIYAAQSAAPTSLAGTYVFTLAGSTPIYSTDNSTVMGSTPQALGGWFACDSMENVNGYLDTNNNGVVESANVSGTLAQSSVGGRWILTLNGGGASKFAVYPTTNHGLLMFQLDSRKSGVGAALVQTVPVATLQGTYAASAQQLGVVDATRNSTTAGNPVGAWSDLTGQIIVSGSANATGTLDTSITGTLDIDQVNGLYIGLNGNFWTQTPAVPVTGDFTDGAQGRLTGSITVPPIIPTALPNTMGLIFYVVDNSTVMVLEQDTTPAVGILRLQNF